MPVHYLEADIVFLRCPLCGHEWRPRKLELKNRVCPSCHRRSRLSFNMEELKTTAEVRDGIKKPVVEIQRMTEIEVTKQDDFPDYFDYLMKTDNELSVDGYLRWKESSRNLTV